MIHRSIRRAIRCASSLTAFLLTLSLFFAAGIAFAAAVGDQVELKATHSAGVPFHNAPGGSQTFQRVPTGTIAGSPPPETSTERLVWTSPEGCQQVVGSGGRMAPADPATLRVGTWNIRWFPRGCPANDTCPDKTMDIPWLACTTAWMNVDLLALQEILATPDAEFSLNALRTELERLTGGSWQVDLHVCGAPSTQHVGFLWKSARVALLELTDSRFAHF